MRNLTPRKKKKRSAAGGRRIPVKPAHPSQSDTALPGPAPISGVLRTAFALGVGGTIVLVVTGLYESLRTERRLPGVSAAYMEYIESLFETGDHGQALDQLHLARALDIVNEPLVLNNLANAMQAQGRTSEAMSYYREAIRIKPDYAMAYYNLAKALAEQGEAAAAVELYRTTVELDPSHVDAHNNLANLLAGQGAMEEAFTHYERALSLQPDNAAARNNLAWALAGEGRLNEALLHFQEAVRLRPELASSLIGLSWILATHPEEERRDPGRALELADRALELLPAQDPRSLDIAAAAHAAAGDYEGAVELAQTAADLSPPNFPGSQAIRERLALYRQRRPYREGLE